MPPGAKPWPDPARGPGGVVSGYQKHIWLSSDSTLYAETRARFNRSLKWLRVHAPGGATRTDASVRRRPEAPARSQLPAVHRCAGYSYCSGSSKGM